MRYRARFGDEYDLENWPAEHIRWLREAIRWYEQNMPYEQFTQRILGPASPVLDRRRNGPMPTRSPLYAVATDLQFRLGVKQGFFAKDWDGEVDPQWPKLPKG